MTTFQEIINNTIDKCEDPANRVITGCLVGSKNVYITSNCDGWAEDQAKPLMSFDIKTSLEPCDFIGLTEAEAKQMIILNDLFDDLPSSEEVLPFN